MLDMLDNWTIATNGNRVTVRIIMFDLRKAFDRIDHRILTDKSRSLNLAVSVVNWIMNFFSDQYQRVKHVGVGFGSLLCPPGHKSLVPG